MTALVRGRDESALRRDPLGRAPERRDLYAVNALAPRVPLRQARLGQAVAEFLEAFGIPVYGVPGPWGDPDGNGTHGLNERMEVKSVYVGRDYLTDLVKLYANAG